LRQVTKENALRLEDDYRRHALLLEPDFLPTLYDKFVFYPTTLNCLVSSCHQNLTVFPRQIIHLDLDHHCTVEKHAKTMAPQLLSVVELTEQLNEFLQKSHGPEKLADDAALRKLSEAARKVGFATEATGDTVHRIAHSVCLQSLAI
jgi:hypothetical protein